jgi:DNA-binding response OmpR family regulator
MDRARNTAVARRRVAKESSAEVVIVCAEEDVRDVVAHWLAMSGKKVLIAADGYEAAATLRQGCRWLITDRVLPPWPGLDQFLALRGRYPTLGIVFIENSNIHDTILARVTGANVTLSRPLTRRAVIEAFGIADAPK